MRAALAIPLVALAARTAAQTCSKAGCAGVKLLPGTDFLNTDGQTNAAASSAAECCKLCSARAGCVAFVYRTDQKQCWMKKDAANPTKNPLAIGGNCGPPAPPPKPGPPPPPPPGPRPVCVGEFTPCPGGSHCAMGPCGGCKFGQYLCPTDQKTCIDGPEQYMSCPGLKGTHLDPSLTPDDRIDYLLNATSLDEQIAQLQNKAPAIDRLGVPSYNWLNDDQKATVFPNGCGLGATWSKQTIHAAGAVLGAEARGLHNYFLHNESNRGGGCNGCGITIYGPNLNLVKDPRWGRGQETFGEDPHLMARLVVAWITGAQNNSVGSTAGPDGKHMLSGLCCKHFAAYNVEDKPAARYVFNANLSSQSMWETYMPAFQACIMEAKATHVMCSYNSVNGIPTCGSKGLLTEVLREQWGFDGFVVSDYDAWANIKNTHNYVPTMEDAAATGLNAGMDQEGGGSAAIDQLHQAVTDGKTTAAAVATAVRRNFRIRLRLGMMDPPSTVSYNALDHGSVLTPANLEVARRAALESMTLLKNGGALPLDPAKFSGRPGSLAVLGPQAPLAGLLHGNYAESAANGGWGTSILDAIAARVGNASVAYAKGCGTIGCDDDSGFADAVAAASKADAVIITMGLSPNGMGGGGEATESEGHDRSVIELPGKQGALVAAVRAANPRKPIVALLIHGGTLALGSTAGQLDAVLSGWYPGIEGGPAIAATLFGDYSPAGRSPNTWYTSTAALPADVGDMDESANGGITYRYIQDWKHGVAWPFGHGLSYTTFAYSKLSVSAALVPACSSFTLTVTVANTGGRDGEEVVQVYAKLPDATVPTTRVRLVAFERVLVPKGGSVAVQLEVKPDTYAVVHGGADVYRDTRVIEAGKLELAVGGGQPDYYAGALATTVAVTDAKPLAQC